MDMINSEPIGLFHARAHAHAPIHKTSTKPRNDRKRNKLKVLNSEQKPTNSHKNSQLLGGTETEN